MPKYSKTQPLLFLAHPFYVLVASWHAIQFLNKHPNGTHKLISVEALLTQSGLETDGAAIRVSTALIPCH